MNAHIRGDETIKVALVGCGSRGTGAVTQALRTKGPIKLWAMADLFADRLESSLAALLKGEQASYDREAHAGLASQIEVPPERRFTGFDAYRQAIASGVDLVILASPPHFRPMHFEYAVGQGKHLFMEKPLAVDAPGIRQILAANGEARKKDLKVGVGLMFRHHPTFRETVARVQEGAIGPIQLLRAYWNTGFLRDTPARDPGVREMVYQLRNPYHFLWLSGDYFVDALMHFLDVCLWVKDAHPEKAQGQGGRQMVSPMQNGDIFDHHAVEYTFADGTRMFATTRQIAGCWNSASAHVHGLTGCADVGRGRIEGQNAWRYRGRSVNPYQREHDVLLEAIRQGKPHNEVDYAARSTMTAILGRMASYSGQEIAWEAAIKSSVRLAPDRYAFDAKPPVAADATGRYPVATPGVTKVL
jgi:myo-inositol 2-dehydrogenase / D-chiro-inositol 1-dehydrogenase